MIEVFKYIRNIGRFEKVKAGANTALAPLTLVYSENGRGKTTLCAILRSLANGDPAPILERHRISATSEPRAVVVVSGDTISFDGSAWTSAGPKIAVFDEHFVDTNVHSGLNVGAAHRKGVHELVVGEKGVQLQRQVQELTDTISSLQTELREKERAIPAAALGSLSVQDFCALRPIDDLDGEIQAATRSLSVLRDADSIRTKEEFKPIAVPSLDLEQYDEVLRATVRDIEATAVAAVQRHLMGLGPGSQRWAADGLQYLSGRETCPFCAQDLSGSALIAHYRAYFSEAHAEHKRRIQQARERVGGELSGDRLAWLQRSLQQEKEKREFWAGYTEVPEFVLDLEELAASWTAHRDTLLTALDAKADAPLEPVSLSSAARQAAREYGELAATVHELSTALVQCNPSVLQTKEHAAQGSAASAQQRLAHLQAIQRRFEPEVDRACADYLRVKAHKAEMEREKEQVRAALDAHRERVFGTYQVAINRFLDTFNADFVLEGLQPSDARGVPSSTYSVRVNDRSVGLTPPTQPGPSFRTALSSGDRNTLALAFFFASLEQLDLSETIVVIDDPISSLDDARSFATAQETRKLEGRCRQLILLSHSRSILCQLWERADKGQTASLEIRDCGLDRSTLDPWDVEAAAVTEFDRLHRAVRHYAEQSQGDPQKVAPALRILLESFLRVAFLAHFPPGSQLGDFLQRAKHSRAEGSPILSEDDVQELDNLREYANLFHHSTNQKGWLQALANVNEKELRGYARRVVRFITLDGRIALAASKVPLSALANTTGRPIP
jgi:wobble nucleotide-excising tRNase